MEVDAGVLHGHPGNHRNPQLGGDGGTQRSRGNPVTACFKTGAGHEKLGSGVPGFLQDQSRQGLQVLCGVVVAADHGPHNFGVIPQDLLKQSSRSNGAIPHLGLGIGYFLATDAAEELIYIMHYPHGFDLRLSILSLFFINRSSVNERRT